MAKISLEEEQIETVQKVETIEEPVVTDSEQALEQEPCTNLNGLSFEEIKDPNKINVTIADKDAPIVVLFGPPACGKTMTLVRLTRYLKNNGYTVTPVRTFRPSYDKNYAELCENFDVMINQEDAAKSTSRISFMLVKVSKKGRTLCQLLEAPGELYFDPKAPNSPFPKFLNAIKSCRCRKIWTIMVEPDWLNESDRLNYVGRVKKLRTHMTSRDKAVVVYNKIDTTEHVIDGNGNAHFASAIKEVKDLYTGIFEPFKNQTPIINLFKPYNCDFAIFQTGDYNLAQDGTTVFEPGPDIYPHRLWNIIMKRVRG